MVMFGLRRKGLQVASPVVVVVGVVGVDDVVVVVARWMLLMCVWFARG